ncbi:MAG: hypothetical protein HY787_06950 [Deltaproteobacteria bacterium]|nr:hypothetical protein [Deltaproteobacteria bacterium]
MSQSVLEPTLRYREWVQVMFEQINDPVQLVLDGLDRLTTNASSFLFLKTLAHEAPPHLRLIMLSREEPPFGLQELKIKQQAQVLTNGDLAFNPEETRAFFRVMRKITLSSSQVARIHSSTEGWVGGLLLFSETLEKLPEGEREKYISEKMPDHIKKEAFRFFEEVILSPQQVEIREFLIKSSILDKMETKFVGELLETKDMEEVLQEAARKHLFVQSNYEEGKGWVFRYHQLFRDFLLLKFNTELSPETRQSLYKKAGLLFQQRDRLEDAIQYFLKAGAYESAIPAIEKVGLDLVWSVRNTDLLKWLQALPEKTLQGNPWLLYYFSRTTVWTTSPAKNLPILYQAFTLFEKAGDLRGCLVSLSTLIGTTTLLGGQEPVPMSVLLTKGEDLLSTIDQDLYPRERVSLWMNLNSGFCFFNPRKAYQASQNAYLIARTNKAPLMMQIFALIRSFGALMFVQEISLADEISKEIEKLLKKQPFPEIEVEYHFSQGILFSFKGDLEKAEAEYKILQKECERLGLIYLYTILIHEYLNLKTNLGQHREAEELGQHFLQLAVAQGQFRTAGNILYYLGINCYFEGDYDKAKEYLQQSRKFLPASNYSLIWLLHRIAVFRGFLWSQDEPDETILKDLQNALDYF